MTDLPEGQPQEAVRDLDHACALVGRLLWNFSKLEAAINFGLKHFLSLEEDQGEIVAVNVDFVRKTRIVRAAISWDKESGDAQALKSIDATFEEVRKLNDSRLVVAHCEFDIQDGGVAFKRATADAVLKRQDPVWTVADFKERFRKMEVLTASLHASMNDLVPYRTRDEKMKRSNMRAKAMIFGEDAWMFI